MLIQLQKNIKMLCALVITLAGINASAQTQIFNIAPGTNTPTNVGWTEQNNVTTNSPIWQSATGGYWLLDAGSNPDRVISSNYDISAYATASFSIQVATFGTGNNSPAKIEVSYNGGTSYTQTVTSTTPTSSSYQDYTFSLTQVSSSVKFRISNANTSGRGVRLKNLILTASGSSSPVVTTNAATAITSAQATLNGSITNGNSTAVSFEYGTTTSYGTTATGSPSPITGSGSFTGTATSLLPNTQYNYRAKGGAVNGTNVTFRTRAAVPGAPVTSNATTTTIDVAVSAGANPGTTTYVITVYNEALDILGYVQANGTVGVEPIWQTSSVWNSTTVTGLTQNTTYVFTSTARNDDNLETIESDPTIETTLSASDPNIIISETLAFADTCVDSTSVEENFTINGTNLTTENVIVGPLDGFNFSTTSGGSFTSSLSLTQSGGTYSQAVYVKFSPTEEASYDGNIPVSGGGTAAVTYVAVTATGISTPATVTTAGATNVDIFSATLGGNVTDEGCTTVTAMGVVYATTANPEVGGTGVTNLSYALPGTGAYTVSATGLMPSTTYYARAYATNNSGTAYGSDITFTTSAYVLDAPVADEETAATASSFVANWQVVGGAENYRLDVSLYETFTEALTGATQTEFFNNLGSSGGGATSNYGTRTWTGDDGVTTWSAYKARTDQSLGDDLAITLRDQADSYLISSTISGGIQSLEFDVQQVFGGTGGELTISILTGAGFSNVAFTDTQAYNDLDVTHYSSGAISGVTGDYVIRMDNNAAARPMIDNVAYTAADYSAASFVTGYEDLSVGNVLEYEVTGLEGGTTYYYRVRAENTTYSVTSANSNTITALTGGTVTWTGTEWTPYSPAVIDDAVIAGAYDTSVDGLFTAATLTISETGSIIIASGDNLTITNEVVNNATTEDFIIQDNANLIQINDAAVNTGAVQVEKNSSELYRLDYTIWSAPVAGQNLEAFSPMTVTSRFYDYDESLDIYTGLDPETNDFTPGYGYLIRMPNDWVDYAEGVSGEQFTGIFQGVLNNGEVLIPMETNLNGYNMVGNPYPSPININDFYTENAGVIDGASALYFWRKRNDISATSATYAVITNGAYTANSSAGGDTGSGTFTGDSDEWVINPGQGFFVQASTSGNLVFNNGMRRAVNNNQFFRTEQQGADMPSRYWLNITNDAGLFSQAAVVYKAGKTTGLDYGWDGKAFVNDGPVKLYTTAANEFLAIQARPAFEVEDMVELGYRVTEAGNYTISLDHMDGLFADGQNIYLIDNALDIITNLQEGDYSFTTGNGQIDGRFTVVYTAEALGTDNPVLSQDAVVVYKNNGDIAVDAGNVTINAITIYDVRGRELYSNSNVNATSTVVNGLQSAQQVLIVNIATDKGTVSKKVVY